MLMQLPRVPALLLTWTGVADTLRQTATQSRHPLALVGIDAGIIALWASPGLRGESLAGVTIYGEGMSFVLREGDRGTMTTLKGEVALRRP